MDFNYPTPYSPAKEILKEYTKVKIQDAKLKQQEANANKLENRSVETIDA